MNRQLTQYISNQRFAWAAVLLWIFFIFVSIPLARSMQAFVESHFGRPSIIWVIGGLLLMAGAFCFWKIRKRANWRQQTVVAGVCLGYIVWAYQLSSNPEEAFHLIEYGVLGVLAFWALHFRLSDSSVYPAAWLIGSITGTADEIIQWFTPNRVFDFRDMQLNIAAALLVQLAIAFGVRPAFIIRHWKSKSLFLPARLLTIQLLLIACCMLNTPQRIVWYTSKIPALSYLQQKENLMVEYGYRHQDPKIGVFYSRFILEQLRQIDSERGAQAAAELDRLQNPADYTQFIKLYSPLKDPFLHEVRVHIFRRDQFLAAALALPLTEESTAACQIAYSENQILEHYFRKTIGRSRCLLPPEQRILLAACAPQNGAYESKVSAGLITSFRERPVWYVLIILILCLLAVESAARRKA